MNTQKPPSPVLKGVNSPMVGFKVLRKGMGFNLHQTHRENKNQFLVLPYQEDFLTDEKNGENSMITISEIKQELLGDTFMEEKELQDQAHYESEMNDIVIGNKDEFE